MFIVTVPPMIRSSSVGAAWPSPYLTMLEFQSAVDPCSEFAPVNTCIYLFLLAAAGCKFSPQWEKRKVNATEC